MVHKVQTSKELKMRQMEETKEELKKLLEKGNYKVYTLLRSVSPSGMFRRISCFVIVDNRPVNIDWHIEKLGLFKRTRDKEGLAVSGAGMDMGFHIVYNLSCHLYCPEKEYTHEGAYKLKQEWM